MFELKVITRFAAAHQLRMVAKKCENLHGHNWKIEAEVQASELDEVGMAIDFKVVKRATKKVTDELDHGYLNDIPPFDSINPTAENIAAYIYRRLGEEINEPRVHVHAITIWETERACVRYTEETAA